jgi:lipopolysaccharide/colanic/teichoic acid biosynthesis glycosyltransferase
MSLVGPRPVTLYEAATYSPHEYRRLTVKPGITGLWQVSGRARLTYAQTIALDLRYVRHRSTRLDLLVLARTIPAVFRAESS